MTQKNCEDNDNQEAGSRNNDDYRWKSLVPIICIGENSVKDTTFISNSYGSSLSISTQRFTMAKNNIYIYIDAMLGEWL